MDCDEFFQWMRDTHGLDYGEIEFLFAEESDGFLH